MKLDGKMKSSTFFVALFSIFCLNEKGKSSVSIYLFLTRIMAITVQIKQGLYFPEEEEEVISDRQSSPFFISYLWCYLSLFCLSESLRLSFYFLTKFSYLYRNLTDHSIAPGGIRTSIKERPSGSEAGALSVEPSTHNKNPQFVSNYTELAILYKRLNSQLYWFP